jgi:hypothetical protein
LYLDVSKKTGAIKFNFPKLDPDEMTYSCVLDEVVGVEEGLMPLEAIGERFAVTRERTRQIEAGAMKKLKPILIAQDIVPVNSECEHDE